MATAGWRLAVLAGLLLGGASAQTTNVSLTLRGTASDGIILDIGLPGTNGAERVEIHGSTDLIFDTWRTLGTVSNSGPVLSWTNAGAAGRSKGFYRIVYAPSTNRVDDGKIDPDDGDGGTDGGGTGGIGGDCGSGGSPAAPGTAPVPPGTESDLGSAAVTVRIGDHSESASESYSMTISGSGGFQTVEAGSGEVATEVLILRRGHSYTVALAHTGSENVKECDCCDYPGTCCEDDGCGGEFCYDCPCDCECNPADQGDNSDSPDYDYTAEISGSGIVVVDPAGILGVHEAGLGGSFAARGRTATLHVPGGLLETADTGGAGLRASRTRLVMVSSGGASRAADIALVEGGGLPPARPVWSGSGVSGAAGSLRATFSGGAGSTVSAGLGGGHAATVRIEVVDEARVAGSLDFDSPKLMSIQEALNNVLDHIGGTEVDVGGRLAIEFKRVDYHNDGSRFGGFASIQGAVDAAFPDIAISSPPLPIGGGGAITLEGGFAGSTVTLAANTTYDASKENPGAVSGSLAGSTAAQIGATASMGVRFIGNVSVMLEGDAALTACGGLALSGGEIVASGSVEASDFMVTATGRIETMFGDGRFTAIHTFDYAVSSDFETVLHNFGGGGG